MAGGARVWETNRSGELIEYGTYECCDAVSPSHCEERDPGRPPPQKAPGQLRAWNSIRLFCDKSLPRFDKPG